MLKNYQALENAQFEIRYTAGEQHFAQAALEFLQEGWLKLTDYFQLAQGFPKIRVVLVTKRPEFDRLVRDLLRIEIEVPSHPARIAQPQRTDLIVISPSAYEHATIFKYAPAEFGRLLVHEQVHMVEEYLSPNIEASPRWWGEGLAVYLSEQWRYDDEFRKPALVGVADAAIPHFAQLETERKMAYDWGWTMVRFIERQYGQGMILRIVKECGDGNVFTVMGENASQLESQWRHWLQTGIQNA